MKIHKDDTVVVIAGKNKGAQGKVLRSIPGEQRVIVEGVAIKTVHKKPAAGQPGQIIKTEAAIHVSNVALLDPTTKKPSRIGYVVKDGKKVRVAKKSGTTL
jgi:large subunit ribosomal protein L24